MTRENAFLRALFPEKHWENGTGKPMRYKFMEGNYEKLIKAGVAYLMTVLTGKEIETGIDRKRAEIGNKIYGMLKETGIGKVMMSANLDFRHAIMWINSTWKFFELGMDKEKEGLKPKVYISW